MSRDEIRIGNAGGYWGDDITAIRRQLLGGPLDYISLDFLAEVTMSIMQKQRARDPSAGFARDFVTETGPLLPEVVRRGTRIVTNAGGVNPTQCARALLEEARRHGVDITVGVVDGDDILGRLDELADVEGGLADMETGTPFSTIQGRVTSANAYFGALPIVRALEAGSQIVVTGRTTDTGITLAPIMHAFGLAQGDHDRLASGIVAGHIIECGAQATGGNLTDWDTVPDLAHIGYPIIEAHRDGSFSVTKHEGTGGAVTIQSVTEQLVYEMGDPRAYLTPDVVADFTTIRLSADGHDRVRVSGVRGAPPTPFLKVSVSYGAGYKVSGSIIVSGPRALDKARAFAGIFWERLGTPLEDSLTELVGHDACHGHLAHPGLACAGPQEPHEVLLRLSARDTDRARLETFARLVPALILSGPPGVSLVGGKPQVSETIAYWPTLVPRERVTPRVTILGRGEPTTFDVPWTGPTMRLAQWLGESPASTRSGAPAPDRPPVPPHTPPGRGSPGGLSRSRTKVPLWVIAYARSGDKGDTANIGLVARRPDLYPILARAVTADRVKEWFGPIVRGEVVRHEVPNILALNFLLERSLGGGGTLSLRIDPQGKTLAHALLKMEVEVDEVDRVARGRAPRSRPPPRPGGRAARPGRRRPKGRSRSR